MDRKTPPDPPRVYKPLLPALPGAQNATSSPFVIPGPRPLKRRKREGNARSACDACRTRKTACDAQQPQCGVCRKRNVECKYSVRAISLTESQLMSIGSSTGSEDAAGLRTKLSAATEILDMLEKLPETESLTLLRHLRSGGSRSAVLASFKGQKFVLEHGFMDGGERIPRHILSQVPPGQQSLEFELMMRHPFSYPALIPADEANLGINNMMAAVESPRTELTQNSGSQSAEALEEGGSNSVSDSYDLEQLTLTSPENQSLCDERLNGVRIGHWTKVQIPNETAAKILSLYLETDHPILGLFDVDLFLDNLLGQQHYFCSSFLVSSLLAWACHGYAFFESEAEEWSTQFYQEAVDLWGQENKTPLLTSIAACVLLNLNCCSQGKDKDGMYYLNEAISMGKKMGLFGVDTEGSARSWLDHHQDWVRAACHTAWGSYCYVSFRCLHFQSGKIDGPPLLPVPGDEGSYVSKGVPIVSHGLPPYMGKTLPQMCKLWPIVHKTIFKYYEGGNDEGNMSRANLGFAEKQYLELLQWSDNLPVEMARSRHTQHHAITAHIYYHAAILDLFRPFMRGPNRTERLEGFDSPDSTPEAVVNASLKQLQRLVLVYRTTFPSASYSFLWHTALLYVANPTLREPREVEWQFWFRFCLAGYRVLAPLYKLFKEIVQALLCVAIEQEMATPAESRRVIEKMINASPYKDESGGASSSSGSGGSSSVGAAAHGKLMVDLDLAMTDPLAACVGALVERYQGLALFDQYTMNGTEETD